MWKVTFGNNCESYFDEKLFANKNDAEIFIDEYLYTEGSWVEIEEILDEDALEDLH